MTETPPPKGSTPLRSAVVTNGANRAAARSYLRAAGLQDADFARPLIAVVNTWSSVTPCNMHLGDLAEHVRRGVREADLSLLAKPVRPLALKSVLDRLLAARAGRVAIAP